MVILWVDGESIIHLIDCCSYMPGGCCSRCSTLQVKKNTGALSLLKPTKKTKASLRAKDVSTMENWVECIHTLGNPSQAHKLVTPAEDGDVAPAVSV